MPTTILLIRHGRTAWNVERRLQGSVDTPLDDEGVEQARKLARRIVQWPVTALYSSPQQRAVQTANILGETLGLAHRVEASWREKSFGELEGLTRPEIRDRFPEVYTTSLTRTVDPPGGETERDLSARVCRAYAKMLLTHPDETVAVVSHGATLRSLCAKLFNLSHADRHTVSPRSNTGVTVIEASTDGVAIVVRNDTSHLGGD